MNFERWVLIGSRIDFGYTPCLYCYYKYSSINCFVAGRFVCEFCHLPFISRAKFVRHRKIHTDEKPYSCIYCHSSFTHHSELRKHREEQHMSNKSFKCSHCPKTFSTRGELKGHLWRHTGNDYVGFWIRHS